MPPSPTVGRQVHYLYPVADGALVPLAATVIDVHSDTCVDLAVLASSKVAEARIGSTFPVTSATLGTGERNWAWPPMVGAPAANANAGELAALTARIAQLEHKQASLAAALEEPEITVTHDVAPIATPAPAGSTFAPATTAAAAAPSSPPATEPAKP